VDKELSTRSKKSWEVERCFTPNGGYAEVVKHSVSKGGKGLITFNVKYGLIIHAEVLRHKLINHSVKSNRAIPSKNIRKEVLYDPYVPVYIGLNQPGMVAEKVHPFQKVMKSLWRSARYPAIGLHWLMDKCKVHKEVCNRVLNPWQWVRETVTATEMDNFYNLRLHKDAQKDIYELAKAMYQVHKNSSPEALQEGEWHVPYVDTYRCQDTGGLKYVDRDGKHLTDKQAIECSAARCARSSYDNHDKTVTSYEKDKSLYEKLIKSEPAHASPCEHIGTPMEYDSMDLEESLEYYSSTDWSHVDRNGDFWSGNFKGWVQYRKLLDNEACWEYKN